jgi:hypothetical protein
MADGGLITLFITFLFVMTLQAKACITILKLWVATGRSLFFDNVKLSTSLAQALRVK